MCRRKYGRIYEIFDIILNFVIDADDRWMSVEAFSFTIINKYR